MKTTVHSPFEKQFEHSQALFVAALEEFISAGYEQASLNAILDAARMSKGQFYYHFKNKEDLYLALIEIMIDKKKEFLTKVMQPEDLQGDIFSIFKVQIRYSMLFAREHPEINRFAESFVKERGNPIYTKAIKVYNFEENKVINKLVEAAYQRGEFREDLPNSFIHKIIAFLFTHFAELLDFYAVEAVEENMQYLIELMKSGLERQPHQLEPNKPGKSHDDDI
jgi:AcrR family transcriptional regulator